MKRLVFEVESGAQAEIIRFNEKSYLNIDDLPNSIKRKISETIGLHQRSIERYAGQGERVREGRSSSRISERVIKRRSPLRISERQLYSDIACRNKVKNIYSIIPFKSNNSSEINTEGFLSIVKGRSIIGANENTKGEIIINLGGNIDVKISHSRNGNSINLSKRNKKDEQSFSIALGDMPQQVPFQIIETKLNGLRTLYAILHLSFNGKSKKLEAFLLKDPNGDIEKSLLRDNEKLYVESISYGSWIVTLRTKAKKASEILESIILIVFERGRESYLQKKEAEAKIMTEKAKQESIKTEARAFKLQKNRIAYINKLYKDFPDMKEVRNPRQSRGLEL